MHNPSQMREMTDTRAVLGYRPSHAVRQPNTAPAVKSTGAMFAPMAGNGGCSRTWCSTFAGLRSSTRHINVSKARRGTGTSVVLCQLQVGGRPRSWIGRQRSCRGQYVNYRCLCSLIVKVFHLLRDYPRGVTIRLPSSCRDGGSPVCAHLSPASVKPCSIVWQGKSVLL